MNSVQSGSWTVQRGKCHKKGINNVWGGKGRRKVTLPESEEAFTEETRELLRPSKHSQGRAGKTSTLGGKNSISKSSESRKGMKKVSIMKTKCLERPNGAKLG